MKYRLNKKQEIVFWSTVSADLADTLQLSPSSESWNTNDLEMIASAMINKLKQLDQEYPDKKVSWLCGFIGKKIDISTNNLYKILVQSNFNTTRDFTKHRFSFFLIEKSADDYIIEKNILQSINIATPSNSIGITSSQAVDKLHQYILKLEFRAKLIHDQLTDYYEDINVQNFLNTFHELHRQNITSLQQGDLDFSREIILRVYELSKNIHFTANKNTRYSMESYLKSPLYSSGGKRLGVLISIYLTGENSLDKYFVDFYKSKNKSSKDWDDFFERIGASL